MSQEDLRWRQPRLLIVHGPHGVDVSAILARNGIRLNSEDLLIIAEHDDAPAPWLEQERVTVRAA
ncbi:hypothetical protein [Allosphingosinicella sp.]|uniref:hypothetical protein n=1 Tax=Allosphingosinicella sp. TaxID=2823234 RepID=UPI002FC1BB86